METISKAKGSGPIWLGLYEGIRSDILSGKLRDGSKLSEASLCKKYGVSRTPVREALFQLEAEGLVQIIPNRGAFVKALSGRDVSDIFDINSILEIKAVEWAIKRMSAEEIDKLSEILDFMEFYAIKGDAVRVFDFYEQFHRAIHEGAGDRMLLKTLTTYRTYIMHTLIPVAYSAKQLKELCKEHKDIFIAFESKNTEAGCIAMKKHTENSRKRRFSIQDVKK